MTGYTVLAGVLIFFVLRVANMVQYSIKNRGSKRKECVN